MTALRWRVCRLFGIQINIDGSWLIIFALLTWSLTSVFSIAMPGYVTSTYLVMGLASAFAFFSSVVLHELGHAVAARKMGMKIRGITLFLFGGVAELEDEPPSARAELWMAIAGPAVSLVLAGLFFGLSALGIQLVWEPVVVLPLLYLGWMNLVVLLFNMVPAFPLDGGRVLRSILWATGRNLRKATRWSARCGQIFAWLLVFFGLFLLMNGNVIGGIWMSVLGLFLHHAARMSYQQVLIRQALQGEPLHRFMSSDPVVVDPSLNLEKWVDEHVYRHHHKAFPVLKDGQVQGLITTQELAAIPRRDWSAHTVDELMQRDLSSVSLSPDSDALDAFKKMSQSGTSRLLVLKEGQLLGLISLKDLLRFLDLKLDLQGEDESSDEQTESRQT